MEGNEAQTDIRRAGLVFSTVYIPTVTLIIHSLLLAIIVHGYQGVPQWWFAVWKPTSASTLQWWLWAAKHAGL